MFLCSTLADKNVPFTIEICPQESRWIEQSRGGCREVVSRMYQCLDLGGDYHTGWFGILYTHVLTSHIHISICAEIEKDHSNVRLIVFQTTGVT